MSQSDAILSADAQADPPAPAKAASGFQIYIVGLLSFIIMVIDGYDIGSMPVIVPHLAQLWGEAPALFAPALSAVVIGLGLGAFFLGPLGDKVGRRTTTVVALGVISFATLGTSWSQTVSQLFWWRLLTGTALGACLPNVLAILAEVMPAKRRASAMTIVGCGIPVGAAGAGVVVPWLTAGRGWEAAFTVPATFMFVITILLALFLTRLPAAPIAAKPARERAWHWTDIPILAPLGRGYLLRTTLFSALFCFNALSMYMLASWLPTVLRGVGFSFETSAHMASIVQIGGLVGGLILATQIDRHRTIPALLAGYALVSLGLVALAVLAPTFATWGLLMLIIGMGVGGAHIALTAVAASIYPITMLSAAIGLAVAVARVGAMAGPLVGGALIAANMSASMFFLALLVPVGCCILCVLAFSKARIATAPSAQEEAAA
ncbi:AAHS family 4-hydroxybenzoate transporter-like MFS transporter [Sphingobium sp. B7D2B]|uniref:MFS transporter n=1 Tax=Sphingobium sp. B7D2B TaxID=2940583 RepID=UPI0022243AEE|nr:MFS transporter [Sphingobium sp. B7D2B]MCW2365389.1 AAHS family 4-hydroxybenzoate transporter-like MFS transporter [Sphingobium sp. B7D2B]